MTTSAITRTDLEFGRTAAGAPVRRWTVDDGDLAISVLDLGGVIQSLLVPDRAGRREDVVLGFDDVSGYESTRSYAGGIIGRYANRIAGGTFPLPGPAGSDLGEPVEVQLARNEGPNTVHGGPAGFHTRIWSVEPLERDGASGLRLSLTSPDGDQGFPGRLDVVAEYLLVPGERRLLIDLRASTDAPTVVSLTQHSYFNLGGVLPHRTPAALSLDGHQLSVNAGHYTPVDNRGLPSGEIAHVVGTPFDLRTPQPLDFLSLDHNFVLAAADEDTGTGHGHGHGEGHRHGRHAADDDGLHPAALLEHPGSGRRLEILTTEPGLQVYTGSGLDGSDIGKDGVPYRRAAAVALETQHYPDSPNHPEFPPTGLRPGERYLSRTEWRFR